MENKTPRSCFDLPCSSLPQCHVRHSTQLRWVQPKLVKSTGTGRGQKSAGSQGSLSSLLDPKSNPSPDTLRNLSNLQFPYRLSGSLVPTHLLELFWGLNERVHVNHLRQFWGP